MYNHTIIKNYIRSNNYKDKIDYNPMDNNCIAIIFETRNIDTLDWVTDTVKYFTNWKIRHYCSYDSYGSIDGVEKSIIPTTIDYNEILKDVNFWRDIDEEHVLVFQWDSFILRHGIEEFLDYDYIGAPWKWSYGEGMYNDKRYPDLTVFRAGGNGGFSLRRKSAMVKLINDNPPNYEYEDMYFSNALKDNIPLEVKKRFAAETMFYEDPLAVHSIHKYLSDSEIQKILFK